MTMTPEQQKQALAKSEVVNIVATSRIARGDALREGAGDLVTSNSAFSRMEFQNDGSIKQSERLFTARPRYAPAALNQDEVYAKSTAARGTHAYIKLLTSNEQASKYSSSRGVREGDDLTGPGSLASKMVSTNSNVGYDDFLLTRVSCNMAEKLQVTETFGDGEVAYYFGHQPVIFDITGVLMDSPDNSWFTNWLRMYSSVLRGSQLAQNNELLRLVLPNMILVGTINSTNWAQDSANDVAVSFGFQFLAKRIEPTAAILENVAASQLGGLIDFNQASQYVSQQSLNSFKSQVARLQSAVSDPNSTVASLGSALSGLGEGIGGSIGELSSTLDGAALGVKDFVDNNAFSHSLSGTASLFRTLSANLNGIRAQLFSPIYGILTSLTRLVQNTTGDISSIFNSLLSPVRNTLRDITNISNQAIGLVNLANSSIRGIGRGITGQIGGTVAEFNLAMKSLGDAAGSVATSPLTAIQSVQDMFKSGTINSGAAFLQENTSASLSSSGVLAAGGSRKDYKIAILLGLPPHSAAAGAKL